MFRRRSLSSDASEDRNFMDWRKVITILAIVAGQLPTNADIQAYESQIRAKAEVSEGGLLQKDSFIKVSIANTQDNQKS